jgi:transcriptional regulator with XRE-family HTH domain
MATITEIEKFGLRLRALREAARISVEELAARLEVKPATVYHYETGRRDPGVGRLPAIIAALGCAPADLLSKTKGK